MSNASLAYESNTAVAWLDMEDDVFVKLAVNYDLYHEFQYHWYFRTRDNKDAVVYWFDNFTLAYVSETSWSEMVDEMGINLDW